MTFAALLYDPIYAAFGLPARLTPNRPEASGVAATIISRSARTDVSEEFELGTVRPSAALRNRELIEAGIPTAELDGGLLSYGARSWRIEAHAMQLGPEGEVSGEIILYLSEASDA